MLETVAVLEDVQFESMVKPNPDELLAFYERQGHPTTHAQEKLERMLENTFCFVVARHNGALIGFARGVTDGLWGRLAECKLDPTCQGPGADQDQLSQGLAQSAVRAHPSVVRADEPVQPLVFATGNRRHPGVPVVQNVVNDAQRIDVRHLDRDSR